MKNKQIAVLLSLVNRFRLLFFLTLAFTIVLIITMYSQIRKSHKLPAYDDVVDLPSMKYLLTINHDFGRLGNKMFKYASLLGIAKREGRTPFVLPYAEDMETLFDLTHVRRYDKNIPDGWPYRTEKEYAYFDPVFLNLSLTNMKLIGYVQSWKYFQNVEKHVRQEFRLSDKMKSEADQILNSIRQKFNETEKAVLVGVHVRRCDERSPIHSTCKAPKSFFINAFDIMKILFPGQRVIFVVAGNELKWCRENLAGNDVTILEPAATAVHFAVLSSCQHFIVSVGSFGWWAGWLTGGLVIFYKNAQLPGSFESIGFHYEDYYPPSWIPVGD